MTASAVSDVSPPVRYLFECTSDPGASSGWQTSPTFTAAGLAPSTLYTFRVRARDSAPVPNETATSGEQSAVTYPAPVSIIGSWPVGTTHTKEPGANRVLLFIAHAEDNEDPSITLDSVSYGGQPMTKIIELAAGYTVNSRAYVVAYLLDEQGIAAAQGDTFDFSWNQPPDSAAYSSVFLADVNQAAPVGLVAANSTQLDATIATSPLPTYDGDMAIVAATRSGTGTYYVNNGFIKANELPITGADAVVGYKPATGVAETPSVTHTSTTHRQALTGIVIQAAGDTPGYQTCPEVMAGGFGLPSDLNGDCYIDWYDMAVITNHWLFDDCDEANNYCERADLDSSGYVDFIDFSDMGSDWRLCNNPADPDCTPNW